jgi:acyl-CoA thioesterase-1
MLGDRFGLPSAVIVIALLTFSACRGGACTYGGAVPEQDSSPRRSGGAAPTVAAPVAVPADTPVRPKIVALGDSLTAGYGLVESQSYPALLQKRIDAEGYAFDVVNAGVSGDTSAGGLRRLDWVLEGDVKVVVVALGANDGLRGLSIEEMKRNLRGIIAHARERNAVVILAGMEAPPNYGPEYASAFRQAYREIAQRERVVFIPFLLDKVAGHSALNQGDGIHPNVQGTRIVADTIWAVLRPLLDQIAASSS